MKFWDRIRSEIDRREREKWDREHRWHELATYNMRVSQGIVHTPEYVALMEQEQRRFNIEQYGYEEPWKEGLILR